MPVAAIHDPTGVERGSLSRMLSASAARGETSTVAHGTAVLGAHSVRPDDECADPWTRLRRDGDVSVAVDGWVEGGESATGVVLRAYRRHGTAFPRHLHGDFALVLWDGAAGTLVAARNRTGTEHLYVGVADGRTLVGSEVGMVAAAVGRVPNLRVVGAYLRGDLPRTPETFYRDVYRLPRATSLRSTAGRTAIERYWDPSDSRDGESVPARALRDAVVDAVQQRADRATAPGVLLSGGTDSASVTAALDRATTETVHAVSGVTASATVNERDGIDAVVERTAVDARRIEWHSTAVRARAVADRLPDHPCVDTSLGFYADATRTLARRGRRSVFTGHGGNLWDGNRFYYHDLAASGDLRALARRGRRDDLGLPAILALYVAAPLLTSVTDGRSRAQRDFEPMDDIVDDSAAEQHLPASLQPTTPTFDAVEKAVLWRHLTDPYMDFAADAVRQLAHRNGVVLSHPLLDGRVVSLLFSLPPGALHCGGEPKGLFKRALGDLLPPAVARQRVDANAYGQVVEAELRERLGNTVSQPGASSELGSLPIVDGTAAGEFCREFRRGRHSRSRPVWRLAVTEQWLASLPE